MERRQFIKSIAGSFGTAFMIYTLGSCEKFDYHELNYLKTGSISGSNTTGSLSGSAYTYTGSYIDANIPIM
jgi:hypothetical protein